MKHSTKVLALLLSLIMMLSVATIGSFAADVATTSTWDGVAVSNSLTGTGTEDDPCLISSAADLAYLAKAVNDGTLDTDGKYFKQTVNINLDNKAWTPIGNDQKTVGEGEAATKPGFAGIYDGNYMTISGLKVTDESASFTVEVPATESTPASTETKYGGAALFGYTKVPTQPADPNADPNYTEIMNLAVIGEVNTTKPVASAGLIAVSDDAHITNCYVDVDVTVDGNGKYVAGVAANPTQELIIDSTVNAGDVVVTGVTNVVYAGGFAGYCRGGNNKMTNRNLVNCYGIGDVTVTATGSDNDSGIRAGGITGGHYNGVMVSNTHFYGTFTYTNPHDVSTYPPNADGNVDANKPRVGYFAGGIGFGAGEGCKLPINMVGNCTIVAPEDVTLPDAIFQYINGDGEMALIGSGAGTVPNPTVAVIEASAAVVPYKVADMFLLEPEVEEEETTEEITDDEDTTTVPEDDDETTGKTETNDNTATDDKGGDDKKDSGCASVVGGLSVIAIVAGAALVLAKKKD